MLYLGLGCSALTWKLECNNEIGRHTKKSGTNNNTVTEIDKDLPIYKTEE